MKGKEGQYPPKPCIETVGSELNESLMKLKASGALQGASVTSWSRRLPREHCHPVHPGTRLWLRFTQTSNALNVCLREQQGQRYITGQKLDDQEKDLHTSLLVPQYWPGSPELRKGGDVTKHKLFLYLSMKQSECADCVKTVLGGVDTSLSLCLY